MITTLESLKSISAYPIPLRTLKEIATRRGINLCAEALGIVLKSDRYRLAKADVMMWLSFAPDISQEGLIFSLPDSDRRRLREQANRIYEKLGDDEFLPEQNNEESI